MKSHSLSVARTVLAVLFSCSFYTTSYVRANDKPSTRDADDLRSWFKQLSDQTPDVRERARIKLMTMPRSRLTELQRIVTDSRPLTAAQAVELRQIVEHVFLSGEEYLAEPPGRAFLGVQMAPISVPESESGELSSNSADRIVTRVMVSARFPGFNAYPMLRDGDVILAVVGSDTRIGGLNDLPTALTGAQPGTTIELEVQRAGQLIRLPIRLSRRPMALNSNDEGRITKFTAEREEAATRYWEQNFAKLLDRQML